MNNDYEMDGASFSSRSETDFLSFLDEREDNAQWLEEEIKVMKVQVQDMFSPRGGISEAAKREAHFYVTGSLIGELYLRDIAISSLLERARISGYALTNLSHDDFADVVTRCLQTAKNSELTKVRVQDGKRRTSAPFFVLETYNQTQLFIFPKPNRDRQLAGRLSWRTLTALFRSLTSTTVHRKRSVLSLTANFCTEHGIIACQSQSILLSCP